MDEKELRDKAQYLELRELRLDISEIRRDVTEIRRSLEAIYDFISSIVVKEMDESESAQDESELPADFPYRDELSKAGIYNVDEIPQTAKQIKEINGVDSDAVTHILRARSKLATKEN